MKLSLLAVLLLSAGAASAHPHSFIDMQTELLASGDAFTGLQMRWTMDPITSADLLYDAGRAKPGSEVWKKLAAEVMANVLGQHYFSELWHGGQRVKFLNLPERYMLSRSGNKAVLEFSVPLAEPQPFARQRFQLLTFDPTYFVDMSYQGTSALRLSPALQSRCKVALQTPQPNQTLSNYALSLDKADAPPEQMDLGRQFAQKVILTCK